LKVCPECDEVYRGEETFCPRDGTRLRESDDSERSTSELPGRIGPVQDLVPLDDSTGEGFRRLRGRLDDGTDVVVTLLDPDAVVGDARRRVSSMFDTLNGSLPEGVLSVYAARLDEPQPYIVEDPPLGESLAKQLDDSDRFDWKTATRIVARVARILRWMAKRDIHHMGLHPGHIFPRYRKDALRGLQIGGWLTAAATVPARPQRKTPALAPWAPYIAPETIRDGTRDDRSAVYTLGMLFYHLVLGKPPFTSRETEDVLRRHLNETPLRLAIAAGADVPIDVDSILERTWSKNPEDRIQTPSAFIGALCGHLGEHPDQIAPPLEPRGGEAPEAHPASKTLHGLPGHGAESSTPQPEAAQGPTEPVDLDKVESGSETVNIDLSKADRPAEPERTHTGSGDAAAPSVIIEEPALQQADASAPGAWTYRTSTSQKRRWTIDSPERVLTPDSRNAKEGPVDLQPLSTTAGTVTREPNTDNRTPPPAGDDALSITDVPGDASGDSRGIGFVEVDDEDDMDNEWFSKSAEDAYLEEDVRNEVDRSEVLRKYATAIGLALLGLATAAFVLVTLTY
jgi:hypothetical protein